ncbi:MAG: type IV pilin N-terminal domain-containing protein [Methanosarcinaceae archaeon]|nr:type IV pilin N-terminal domain-containing protein [Methanosarcinaceae archaeon]
MSYKNWHRNNGVNGKLRRSAGKQKRSLFLDKYAVSDVVGNILMVAITVIMAAIVAVAIFGMEPPANVPHVSYELKNNVANNSYIDLNHIGGQQVKVSELKFMADGVEVFNTTNSSINNTGIWKIGTTITLNTNNTNIIIIHLPSKELLQ